MRLWPLKRWNGLCCGGISGIQVSYQACVWSNMFDFGCLHVPTLLLMGLLTHRACWSFSPHRFLLLSLRLPLVALKVQSEAKKACDGPQCESVRVCVSSLALLLKCWFQVPFCHVSVLLGVCIILKIIHECLVMGLYLLLLKIIINMLTYFIYYWYLTYTTA